MKLIYRPTEAYTKDSGLVITLVLLLIAYWREESFFILLAICTLLLVMTFPIILRPLAISWHYVSTLLGMVTNRTLLTIVFWLILLPVGMARRFLGFDPMKRKEWKHGTQSVFTERNHTFTVEDLLMPY
jgi:hypothetical protein